MSVKAPKCLLSSPRSGRAIAKEQRKAEIGLEKRNCGIFVQLFSKLTIGETTEEQRISCVCSVFEA